MRRHNVPWIAFTLATIGVAGAEPPPPEPRRVTPHSTVEVLDDKTPVDDVISQVRAKPPRDGKTDGKPGTKPGKDPRREKLDRRDHPAAHDDKPDRDRPHPKRERHEVDRDDRKPRRR
jgi:hypothetical protein